MDLDFSLCRKKGKHDKIRIIFIRIKYLIYFPFYQEVEGNIYNKMFFSFFTQPALHPVPLTQFPEPVVHTTL